MKLNYYILSLCIITSCSTTTKNELKPLEVIKIPEGKKIKLSKIIKSFDYVFLSDKEIVGNVFNLKVDNNEYYIHDNISKSILKYDSIGDLMYKIHRVGKGPGEYSMISDFLINDGKVEILNIGNHKKISFDSNGEYINLTNNNSAGWRHYYLNNNVLLSYNMPGGISKESYYLYLWDNQISNIKQKKLPFLPYKDKMLPGNLYPFSDYENTINLCADFSNVVYSINQKKEITPKYQLNFQYYKWPTEEVYKNIYNKDIYSWSKGIEQYVRFLRFMESERFCYLGFYVNVDKKDFFYNKDTKTSFCVNEFEDDIGLGSNTFEIVGVDKGSWYALLRVSQMDNIDDLKNKGYPISEDSEFIILKFKLV